MSQMFYDETLTDVVHAQAPYSSKGRRNTTNASDGIYQAGGSQVLFPLAPSGDGHTERSTSACGFRRLRALEPRRHAEQEHLVPQRLHQAFT
jgi:hypothetical protein